ncbi:dTDP-4-dehydrorhamnose 3,5-epimerase [Chloroflexota bacterium]
MLIKERKLRGVFEIQLEPNEDHRGYFMRVYDDKTFKQCGLHQEWVQENQSLSVEKGTIRGLHFQFPPYTETKLVRVVGGEVLDVFLDLRKGSETFGKADSIRLSADNKKMIYIPRGFAHGICTLTRNCIILYKVDNYYAPANEESIVWNDPDIGIDWPVGNPILSEKDSKAKNLKEFVQIYGGLEV